LSVQHGLHVVRVLGHEGKVISAQLVQGCKVGLTAASLGAPRLSHDSVVGLFPAKEQLALGLIQRKKSKTA